MLHTPPPPPKSFKSQFLKNELGKKISKKKLLLLKLIITYIRCIRITVFFNQLYCSLGLKYELLVSINLHKLHVEGMSPYDRRGS